MAPAPPLVGISEVAELLGVSTRTAYRLAHRDDFPQPSSTSAGRVWLKTEVERWARRPPVQLGRGRGRPPKPPGA